MLSQDLTPKAGSQGIQWNATKRKLNEEPPQNETPTKTTAIEMSLVTTNSLMEISDVPSHMDMRARESAGARAHADALGRS